MSENWRDLIEIEVSVVDADFVVQSCLQVSLCVIVKNSEKKWKEMLRTGWKQTISVEQAQFLSGCSRGEHILENDYVVDNL